MTAVTPMSEDALIRFRITHSDRDLRPLLRRLHRLPLVTTAGESSSADDAKASEVAKERVIVQLESQKWAQGVKRIVKSAESWEKQARTFERRAQETVEQTEQLERLLEEEKARLAHSLQERDHRVRCDVVAANILAKGRTRKELDDEIAALEVSIAEQRASHAAHVHVAQTRIDLMARISSLLEDCRAQKLPVEDEDHAMDVDSPAAAAAPDSSGEPSASGATPRDGVLAVPSSSNNARLSPQALVFQPATPGTAAASGGTTLAASAGATSAAKHSLPSRPSRGSSASSPARSTSAAAPGRPVHALPSRPSALRSVTGPGLEEGEVEGEEGEVSDKKRRTRRIN